MAISVPPILSERLELVSMSPGFLAASLAGDTEAASQLLGSPVPADWFAEQGLMRIRCEDLRKEPGWQPWLLRAVIDRASRAMVGHIGFHTPPAPAYLEALAPGGIELGYTIHPPFRRRGYAREACKALMNWAREEHGLTRFVLSISPTNEPSLRIARHLGFVKMGSHEDEEDGPEDVYLLDQRIQRP